MNYISHNSYIPTFAMRAHFLSTRKCENRFYETRTKYLEAKLIQRSDIHKITGLQIETQNIQKKKKKKETHHNTDQFYFFYSILFLVVNLFYYFHTLLIFFLHFQYFILFYFSKITKFKPFGALIVNKSLNCSLKIFAINNKRLYFFKYLINSDTFYFCNRQSLSITKAFFQIKKTCDYQIEKKVKLPT